MANEERATRYRRLQRRASIGATASEGLALALLVASGSAVSLRDVAEGTVGTGLPAAAFYGGALIVLLDLVRLPFALYQGVALERRYGLSAEPLVHWALDRTKALALALALGVPAAAIAWGLLQVAPDRWWLLTAVVFTCAVALLTRAGPVVLMPLFYHVRPLRKPALEARLVALAQRAGSPVLGAFEWRLSDRTRKANAALAGLGRTRRILVSDTLLAEHSDEEIEIILAHEMAHHVHRDITATILVEAVVIAVALFAADRALALAGPASGLAEKGDLAGMPLALLAAGAAAMLASPARLAISRWHERRADRFALSVTGRTDAFVSAMRRLASQNLAEERPSRLTEILFHSHPPVAARIAAARRWEEETIQARLKPDATGRAERSRSG
jgi:STE24 endopeptidase